MVQLTTTKKIIARFLKKFTKNCFIPPGLNYSPGILNFLTLQIISQCITSSKDTLVSLNISNTELLGDLQSLKLFMHLLKCLMSLGET